MCDVILAVRKGQRSLGDCVSWFYLVLLVSCRFYLVLVLSGAFGLSHVGEERGGV